MRFCGFFIFFKFSWLHILSILIRKFRLNIFVFVILNINNFIYLVL